MDGHTMQDAGESLLARFPAVPRWQLTVADYHRMGEAGILDEDDRVELIEGELVAMSPIGNDHVDTVNTLTKLLVMAVGDRGVVSVQNPVRLNQRNEPQPDLTVFRPRPGGYRAVRPRPEDVLVVIEVAHSSLGYDRGLKRALYARHGVPEFWIINLVDEVVEVHRHPEGETYAAISEVSRSGMLEVAALPGLTIPAGPLFGLAAP